MLRSALLDRLTGVVHGLTTRAEGSVGPASDVRALAARRAAVRALGGGASLPVAPRQVHGADVAVAGRAGSVVGAADAVLTTRRGVPLMVQGADCPLLAMAAPHVPAVAVVHSGWRGTAARVAARAVEALVAHGARATDVRAAAFPGIGPCCFEVGGEVVAAFEASFGTQTSAWISPGKRPGRVHLDLHAALRVTLLQAGVRAEHVDAVAGCTACGDLLWSHRASGGAPQRHGLVVMLA